MDNRRTRGFGGAIPGVASDSSVAGQKALLADLAKKGRGRSKLTPFGGRRSAKASRSPSDITLDPLNDAGAALLEAWPAQDQGTTRNTCIAFAALAMVELYERLHSDSDAFANYSEEYLYSKMRRDHAPDDGELPNNYDGGSTFLNQAAQVFGDTGVCSEDAMEYITGAKKPDFTSEPTQDAELEAHKNRIPEKDFKYFRLSASDPAAWRDVPIVEIIRDALQDGSPVAVAFPVYGKSNQWSNIYSDGWRFGEVLDPRHPDDVVSVFESGTVDQVIKGGHAVCIVGYQEGRDGAEGRFVFKNSWGHRFARRFDGAIMPSPGPGYGTVSLSHMEKHCWEMMYRVADDEA